MAHLMRRLRLLAISPAIVIFIFRRLFKPRRVFQPYNDTAPDRYPRIFRFVQALIGAKPSLQILSFGCSTGEEVFSLRDYFPQAAIKGSDINPGNIAACEWRLANSPDPALSFAVASSTKDEPPEFYDAIFCMAVLRDGRLGRPGVERSEPFLYFEDFARTIESFRDCLKPDGILVIRYSNFRLSDAPAGADFDVMLKLDESSNATPIFGSDNRLMRNVVYPDAVFRKRL